MKNLFAVFMAMLLIFSISVPTFAAEINSSNSTVGASATAERSVTSTYRITIPSYIQATETKEFPTASNDEEKIAIAESFAKEYQKDIERMVSDYQITYYSAVLLSAVGEETDELVALAKQGDEALEAAVEASMSDDNGNPITDINDYAEKMLGITLIEIATYLEYGVLSVPEQFENAVSFNVTAKDVLIDNMEELRVTVSYDNILSDSRGAELDYKIYNKYAYVNNGAVILKASAGNPDAVYSTSVSAMVEPSPFAGTFTDTVTFNASVDYSGTVYEIGATQPDYVLAVFNKDFTKVVIRPNGENSDGRMKDFVYADENNPMYKHADTLKTAVFENGVKNVGSYAFDYFKEYNSSILSSVTLCDTIEIIGEEAFATTDITEITVPSSVKTICEYAFRDAHSLKSVVFENGVETIENNAFYNCSLTSVSIPASVKNIDLVAAFSGNASTSYCSCPYNRITEINVSADNPYFSSLDGVVYNKDMTSLLYYPPCKESATFVIPATVTEIGSRAFQHNQYLTSIEIPNTVKILNDYAFFCMKSLTSLQIGNGVTSIPTGAFGYCKGLTEVTIPSNVKSIGNDAFWCCNSIKNLIISEGVSSIAYRAFANCGALTNVTIPSSVTDIDAAAFAYDDRISAIYGTSGSYAETFAAEKGYTFVAV